jgi:hypothetical protein
MALKPWHQVAIPREDLRNGEPLDAAEFAIHLDQVVDGRAPIDYRDPERFFARTYWTASFTKLAAEIARRLAGAIVGASTGVNLTTQFGGGKTHFLTLLYHLFRAGDAAQRWPGVRELLKEAGLERVPRAPVAVFVGNRFDFVTGTGDPGEPRRRTPWGDLAWQIGKQIGNPALFEHVAAHDREGIVPGGEVVQRLFADQPTLILMDEVLSFTRRTREAGGAYARLGSQFYSFLDVLTREIAGCRNAALVVSLPLSEYEMTPQDEADFQRLDKLLDRLSKAVLLSEHLDIAEIVRRRLFEHVGDPKEVRRTADAYAKWIDQHRQQLPPWFPVDQATQVLSATYPFHPSVLSVFERKWQALPRFQRTRGVLRLLALWVSQAYCESFLGARRDPLIDLGSAPLADPLFRAAVFEQLGEHRLEAAVIADIAGPEANAARLDGDAPDHIKRARLHQKAATVVFFESSGGQVRAEATLPEVRLALGSPGVHIGDIETVLDDLVRNSYHLDAKGTAYWLSHRPKLTKIIADRRAALTSPAALEAVRERVRQTIREIFKAGPALNRRYFPDTSGDIPDTPALTLVVMPPEQGWDAASREATKQRVAAMIRECGGRDRTYKSGLIFVVAENGEQLFDAARTLAAIESLEDVTEQARLNLDDADRHKLADEKRRAERELKQGVWRVYRRVVLLGRMSPPTEPNGERTTTTGGLELREVDLGLMHPSASESLVGYLVARLKQEGLIEEAISPDFLARHWPPALAAWSTKQVRDLFYAAPEFPRLLDWTILRKTIADGVRSGKFGYASAAVGGACHGLPIIGDETFSAEAVEFSDEVVLLPGETALARRAKEEAPVGDMDSAGVTSPVSSPPGQTVQKESSTVALAPSRVVRLSWRGEIPPQKWTNFYMKILSPFAIDPSLRLSIQFEVTPAGGLARERVEDLAIALRDLGLSADLQLEEQP